MKITVKAKLAKRCPCCGSANVVMDNPKWLKAEELSQVTIMCMGCGLRVSAFAGYLASEGKTFTLSQAYTKALTRWNRRAS